MPNSQHSVRKSTTAKPADFAHWFLLPVVFILLIDFFLHLEIGFGLDRILVSLVTALTKGGK